MDEDDLSPGPAQSQPKADAGELPSPGKEGHGTITEIQGDAHFHETVTAAPLNPWSRTSIQLYLIMLVAALNATASGFDGVSEEGRKHKGKGVDEMRQLPSEKSTDNLRPSPFSALSMR